MQNIIDTATGAKNINELLSDKFKDLYNSVGYNVKKLDIILNIETRTHTYKAVVIQSQCTNYKITICDVRNVIEKMKSNKKEENRLNSGCHIENRYYGALWYVDDIIFVGLTEKGLRQIIKICENYVFNYDIRFNGKKSQLLVFGGLPAQQIDIRVNGEPVLVSENAFHLGKFINTKNVFECIDYGITKFNS